MTKIVTLTLWVSLCLVERHNSSYTSTDDRFLLTKLLLRWRDPLTSGRKQKATEWYWVGGICDQERLDLMVTY